MNSYFESTLEILSSEEFNEDDWDGDVLSPEEALERFYISLDHDDIAKLRNSLEEYIIKYNIYEAINNPDNENEIIDITDKHSIWLDKEGNITLIEHTGDTK